MYLNKSKFVIGCLIYGWLFIHFGGTTFILLFAALLEVTDQIKSEEGILMTWFAVGFFFLFFTVFFTKKLLLYYHAYRMSKQFEGDEDGLIEIVTLSERLHMKQRKFVQAFLLGVSKNLLRNCSIYTVDPAYIIVQNGKKTIKERFRAQRCKSCGATNVIRIGFENRCRYCNTTENYVQ